MEVKGSDSEVRGVYYYHEIFFYRNSNYVPENLLQHLCVVATRPVHVQLRCKLVMSTVFDTTRHQSLALAKQNEGEVRLVKV